MGSVVTITDQNIHEHMSFEGRARGLVPRTRDIGSFTAIKPFPDSLIIPRDEWTDRLNIQKRDKARLIDVRNHGANGKPIPSTDQGQKGYCFPAGTLVRMADGSHRAIERVQLNDVVLTAEGNTHPVRQLHVRDYAGELINIKLYGHSHLRCTPEHPILTKRGYVSAIELTRDDWIVMPRYASQSVKSIQTSEHLVGIRRLVKNAVGKKVSYEIGLPEPGENSCKRVPDFIELNANTGRILGLWLAEGFTGNGHGLAWSFSHDEEETLAAELVELIDKEWNTHARLRAKPEYGITGVILQGKLWDQLFTSLCGRLAGGKRIHPDLMAGPREFLEGLFWGWMDGDGKRTGHKRYSGCTISRVLAQQMFDIANFLGLRPGILRQEPAVNAHAKTRQPAWFVTANRKESSDYINTASDYRCELRDDKMYRRVRELTRESYDGQVYNIGVAVDNSYVVEGVAVHNCWAHSSTSVMLLLRALAGLPYLPLNAYAIACIIKHFHDQGGNCADSFQFIAERGVPTYEFWPFQSMDHKNDNPKTWENAAKHKFVGDFYHLEYGNLDQQVSCYLRNMPMAGDCNAWGHSIAYVALEEIDPKRPEDLTDWIWNSWGDSWSENGMGKMHGSKAKPQDCIAGCIPGASQD